MLRTHVDPEAWCREWMEIPDSETDFSCVAQLNGEIAGLSFLDVIDGMGQPWMPERTQGVMGYTLKLRRVIASCNADNVASARVLEKVGMRREQHGVQDSWHAELGWVDGYQHTLLDHEWRHMHP